MRVRSRSWVFVLATVAIVVTIALARADQVERVYERGDRPSGYNSEYIFAATRSVTEMDAPPALRVTLVPLTLVVDVVLLPFEVIAGFFG